MGSMLLHYSPTTLHQHTNKHTHWRTQTLADVSTALTELLWSLIAALWAASHSSCCETFHLHSSASKISKLHITQIYPLRITRNLSLQVLLWLRHALWSIIRRVIDFIVATLSFFAPGCLCVGVSGGDGRMKGWMFICHAFPQSYVNTGTFNEDR